MMWSWHVFRHAFACTRERTCVCIRGFAYVCLCTKLWGDNRPTCNLCRYFSWTIQLVCVCVCVYVCVCVRVCACYTPLILSISYTFSSHCLVCVCESQNESEHDTDFSHVFRYIHTYIRIRMNTYARKMHTYITKYSRIYILIRIF